MRSHFEFARLMYMETQEENYDNYDRQNKKIFYDEENFQITEAVKGISGPKQNCVFHSLIDVPKYFKKMEHP